MVPRVLPLLLLAACASKGGQGVRGQGENDAAVPHAPDGAVQQTARGAKYADVLEDFAHADIVLLAAGDAMRLPVLQFLFERGRLHAIGLESYPRTAQAVLDEFSFGRIDEAALEQRAGPVADADREVLAFAHERRLPVLCLGLEPEIRNAMLSPGPDGGPPLGREGLSEAQKRALPPVPSVVRETFRGPDNGMGVVADVADYVGRVEEEVAADAVVRWYRDAAPEGAQVVILAARERIAPRDRLPGRLSMREGKTCRTLIELPGKAEEADPTVFAGSYADYLWFAGRK